mgnify:CR=1 FL=1
MQTIICTSGHIDHGKTSLVKALTGINTDSLPEEKSKLMTIDLGFAYLNEKITIIDVPGHEKFIKNMATGANSVDLALLAIAADDGIMPQTLEHLNIISHYGIRKCIVAITKKDKVDDVLLETNYAQIKKMLDAYSFEKFSIIKTSIKDLKSIKKLKDAIILESLVKEKKIDRGFFFLPIDRVFLKKGFGTVCTGTVISGTTQIGSELQIFPGDYIGKIRGMQSHGIEVKKTKIGDRVSINFSNLEKKNISRGSTLFDINKLEAVKNIIAKVNMVKKTKWLLKNNQRVHVNIGTSNTIGTVKGLSKPIESDETSNTFLILQKPIVVLNGQKFIIRSLSPSETIAGGEILHQQSEVYGKKELSFLLKKLTSDTEERLLILVLSSWNNIKKISYYSKILNISNENILDLAKKVGINIFKDFLYLKSNLIKCSKIIEEAILKYHNENPLIEKLSKIKAEAMLKMSKSLIDLALLESGSNVIVFEDGYASKKHKVVIKDDNKILSSQIQKKLIESKFHFLNTNDLVDTNEKNQKEILYALKKKKKLIEIIANCWIHISTFEMIENILKEHFIKKDEIAISEFKKMTSTSRKYAIPLLEFLDRMLITERKGNIRVKGVNFEK